MRSHVVTLALAAFTFAVTPSVWGQNVPEIEWIRQFGALGPAEDYAQAVDAEGNVYVAGWTQGTIPGQTSAGSSDAFIRKYDSDGNELWTRQFGTAVYDYARGILIDATGVYVVGYTTGTFPGQTNAGSYDAFVRKYDSDGSELWTWQFGTALNDQAYGISVDASGIYVAGMTNGTYPGQINAGGGDAFVVRYDLSGNQLWARQFGSASQDHVIGVSVDASGVYVAGGTYGTLPDQTSAGLNDVFVRKYDSDGNELWTRQFGTGLRDFCYGISVDPSGAYVVGFTQYGVLPGQTSSGGFDAFVRKYDPDGSELWTRQFGTSGNDGASGIALDATSVYVIGWTDAAFPGQASAGSHDAYVRKYDLSGNELWTRQFGTADYEETSGIAVDASGVYATGSTLGTFPGQTSMGSRDAFVCKYDLNGNPLWTRQFGGHGPANDIAQAVDTDGNIYVAGWTSGTFPGQTSEGPRNAFVRKYDSSGNEIWTRQFGTLAGEETYGISVDASGVYVTGHTYGTFPGQTSAGNYDGFICKYDLNGNRLWITQFGTAGYDYARGIAVDASGVYVTGFTTGTFPGQISAGAYDVFVCKYDFDGSEIWTRQFGTAVNDGARGISVDASGVYIAGNTWSMLPGQTSSGGSDGFVRKYDSDGNEIWTRQFGTAWTDIVLGIFVNGSGVYLAGWTDGALPGQTSAGGRDAFVRTYDSEGNEIWTRQLGTGMDEEAYGISVNVSGVYVAGFTTGAFPGQTSAGGRDAFVRTYDSGGNEFWTYQFGTASDDYAYGSSADASGVYVTGYTNGTLPGQTSAGGYDAFVLKLSVNQPPVADAGPDQTVIVTEMVQVNGSGSSDPDGNPLTYDWSFVSLPAGSVATLSDPAAVNPTFVADVAGQYVVQLVVNDGTVDSDPDQVTITVQTPQAATQAVIAQVQGLAGAGLLNQGEGNSLMVKLEGAVQKLDQGNTNAAVNQLNAFINEVNGFMNAGKLSAEQGQALNTAVQRIIDAIEGVLAKRGTEDASVEGTPAEYQLFQNYPNPFNPETEIRFQLPEASHVVVRIFNMLGQEVRTLVDTDFGAGYHTVRLDGKDNYGKPLASGMYLFMIQADKFSQVKKMALVR